MGPFLLGAYVLAACLTWAAILTPVILVLPLRVEQIAAGAPARDLAFVLAAGGLVATLVAPLCGGASDRTTLRMGRRRPWLLGGTAVAVAGSSVAATADGLAALIAGWCVMNAGFTTVLTMFTAILADQVPQHRRGEVAGLLAAATPVGAALGTTLVKLGTPAAGWSLIVPVGCSMVGVLALCAVLPDRPAPAAARQVSSGPGPALRALAAALRSSRDFGWALFSRFGFLLALGLVFGFQSLYLLEEVVDGPEALASLVVLATVVHSTVLVCTSIATGCGSDRLRRRRPFCVAGALIVAAAPVVMVVSGTAAGFIAGTALLGVGMGLFESVGVALLADVLPDPGADAGKAFGIVTSLGALPQVLFAALVPAWLSAGLGGIGTLLLVATACGVGAAAAILQVRVR